MSEKIMRRKYSESIGFLLEDAVQLTVDFPTAGEVKYSIDRDMLRRSSSVLKNTSYSKKTAQIELNNCFPGDFKVYLNWLHTGTLGTLTNVPGRVYCDLVDGYILGLTLEDFAYCDVMLDCIYAQAGDTSPATKLHLPRPRCIIRAFDTMPKFPKEKVDAVREALVCVYAQADDPERVYNQLSVFRMPDAFIVALIRRLMKDRRQEPSLPTQQCASDGETRSDEEPVRKRLREE